MHVRSVVSLLRIIQSKCPIHNDSMIMEMRIDDYTNNIIEAITKDIIINSKGTTTIGVAKPNQIIYYLRDVTLSHQRKLNMKKRKNKGS